MLSVVHFDLVIGGVARRRCRGGIKELREGTTQAHNSIVRFKI